MLFCDLNTSSLSSVLIRKIYTRATNSPLQATTVGIYEGSLLVIDDQEFPPGKRTFGTASDSKRVSKKLVSVPSPHKRQSPIFSPFSRPGARGSGPRVWCPPVRTPPAPSRTLAGSTWTRSPSATGPPPGPRPPPTGGSPVSGRRSAGHLRGGGWSGAKGLLFCYVKLR